MTNTIQKQCILTVLRARYERNAELQNLRTLQAAFSWKEARHTSWRSTRKGRYPTEKGAKEITQLLN